MVPGGDGSCRFAEDCVYPENWEDKRKRGRSIVHDQDDDKGGVVQDLLGSINYQIGPSNPLTVFYGNYIIGELKMTWLPSVTIDTGSDITVGNQGIGYDYGDGFMSGSVYYTKDSFDFGYESSPIIDGWNSATGMSVSTPDILKPWGGKITTYSSLRVGNSIKVDHEISVEFKARPDQMAVAPLVTFAIGYIYYVATTGDTSLMSTAPAYK